MINLTLVETENVMKNSKPAPKNMSRAERIELAVKQAEYLLEKAGVYASVWAESSLPVLCVEIEWGDWKHDHLRADYIMGNEGLYNIGTETTEEDGSDCYSAIHKYIVPVN